MSIFQGIVLGVLQGIAEFLPISSSGHLIVAQNLFGLEEVPLLFDVFLHVATLLAVVLYFRKKIWELICSFARIFVPIKNPSAAQIEKKSEDTKYIVAIILATFVTGVLGIFSSKVISEISVKLVCAGFIVTALLLIFSSLIEKKHSAYSETSLKSPSWKQSLVIGLAQGLELCLEFQEAAQQLRVLFFAELSGTLPVSSHLSFLFRLFWARLFLS